LLCVEERFNDSAIDSALPLLKISASMSIASLVSMTCCDQRWLAFDCLLLAVFARWAACARAWRWRGGRPDFAPATGRFGFLLTMACLVKK
jgi:hypothetical protein